MVTIRSLVGGTGRKLKSLKSRVLGKGEDEGQDEQRSPHKLPYRQLAILAISRFAEPITLTSVFPYLPEMIESFHIAQADIAFWAGLTSAIFSLSQCLTAVPWGRLSDSIGRKPVILLGLTCTMVTSLVWGFSTSLPMAVVARALQGGMNGNVGIIRTMVAEMCPWKELQPRAFSIMPLVWNLGSVLGPAFGGALSNPYRRPAEDDGSADGRLLWKFPYALPNIVGSCFFLVGIVTGVLFLDETLASRRHTTDYGRLLGIKLETWIRARIRALNHSFRRERGRESEPLLSSQSGKPTDVDVPQQSRSSINPSRKQKAPTWAEVLTLQTTLNLIVYTILATHSVAFDQLLPVFMHHPRTGRGILPLPSLISDDGNFLRFNAGFGLPTGRIGLLFTIYGVAGIFYQFLIFPPLARKYGVANCLRVVLCVMPILYFFAPFTTLVPSVRGAEASLFALWLVKGLCTTFAFPCTTILLTNGAGSVRVLATVNGIATSVSAVGRAAGPSMSGGLFTWGARNGFIIAPFWVLAAVGVLGGVSSFWVVDGEGFGDENGEGEGDEEEGGNGDDGAYGMGYEEAGGEEEAGVEARHFEADEAADTPSPLLSRARTRSSIASQAIIEESSPLLHDEEHVIEPASYASTSSSPHARRSSAARPLRRKSSAALGSGPGFRRLSSNLGETRSGYGTGGGLA